MRIHRLKLLSILCEYEERTKVAKKVEMSTKKEALRAEDIAKGVFIRVSSIPKAKPMIVNGQHDFWTRNHGISSKTDTLTMEYPFCHF